MAKVKEIQVCGGRIVGTLGDACLEYLAMLETTDREKLHFSIILDSGKVKYITFRQMDDGIHVYGSFEGMPNALEWAKRLQEE